MGRDRQQRRRFARAGARERGVDWARTGRDWAGSAKIATKESASRIERIGASRSCRAVQSGLALNGVALACALGFTALSVSAQSYDPAIFQKPIPADQLAFLNRFAGAASGDLFRDKQFRKLMHSVIPNCTFHYGRDMPLTDALEIVLKGSSEPVQIREGRYLLLSGRRG